MSRYDFEFDDADSTQNFVTPDSLQQHAVIIDNYDDETAFFDDYATTNETMELLGNDVQLSIVRERAEGIRRIQNSVHEAGQIFRVFNDIVSQQGEMINTIESGMQMTLENTEAAIDELGKASSWQQRTKDRRTKFVLLFGGILIAIIIVYGSSFFNSSSSTPAGLRMLPTSAATPEEGITISRIIPGVDGEKNIASSSGGGITAMGDFNSASP